MVTLDGKEILCYVSSAVFLTLSSIEYTSREIEIEGIEKIKFRRVWYHTISWIGLFFGSGVVKLNHDLSYRHVMVKPRLQCAREAAYRGGKNSDKQNDYFP